MRLVGQVSHKATCPPASPLTEQTGDSCTGSSNTPERPYVQPSKEYTEKSALGAPFTAYSACELKNIPKLHSKKEKSFDLFSEPQENNASE